MALARVVKFYNRHTSQAFFEDDFYLDRNYMSFFNSNALYLFGYGESVYRHGIRNSFIHPYWSFQIITSGQALVDYNGESKKIAAGDILIVRPGCKCTFTVPDHLLLRKKSILINSGQIISLLCNQGILVDQVIIPLKNIGAISSIYDEVKKLVTVGDAMLAQKLSNLSYAFIIELLRQAGTYSLKNNFDIIINELNATIHEPHTLSSLSQKYKIGMRSLNRMFHKNFNSTPIKYIIDMRMKYAAMLLTLDTMPIAEIAEACGFHSVSFFSKTFKKHYSLSPSDFRNKHIIDELTLKQPL